MSQTIKNRIKELQNVMSAHNFDALFISGTDPHISEYLPEHWETRAFITGFTGSAGTVVITKNAAALWTDSRYFIQASAELQGTGIQLMKTGLPDVPTIWGWLGTVLPKGSVTGTDASCISASQFQLLKTNLNKNGIDLKDSGDLPALIWNDRKPMPAEKVFVHEIAFAGLSREEKIQKVRERMKCDNVVISALDEIAWLFNLRGNDVIFNPVFLAYAIVTHNNVAIYINKVKLPDTTIEEFQTEGILIKEYESVYDDLSQIKGTVCLDINRTNQAIISAINNETTVIDQSSVVAELKSRKSTIEIEHLKNTMRNDGVAMVNLLYWLNQNINTGHITDYDIAVKVEYFRSQQEYYKGISFDTIVGYNETGAIVHRHVTRQTAVPVKGEGLLLIDSGGQYLTGTTDITRTISLSTPASQQKHDFTLVLKGMINITTSVFPQGTKGANLDILARNAMWQEGINYGHGTSHGVGYFLNVHEGPVSIRQEFNDNPVSVGNVLSNEPGIYREGQYGIRIENMIVCVEKMKSEFGTFLGFETLTLCPIDKQLINKDMLSRQEIDWLNKYHQWCFDELSPLLDSEKVNFLKQLTVAI